MTIIKRTDVGRPLTWDELDDNFRQVDELTASASAAVSSASAFAIAAAGSATNSLNSANSAANSAANAAQSAAQAEEYANNASEYARNKFTFYKTASDPDGTIAGLAATTDGQSFWVAQGPDALSAAWQYQNKAGVPVLQAKQPGTAAVTGTIREFPTLAAAQADADAGNIMTGAKGWVTNSADATLADEYINNAGTLEATGRKMPSAMPTGYQAATEVSSSAANTIAITIPGLLVDGSLIYFVSPITNTGPTTAVVTDAAGNVYTRTIYTGPNSPLSARDLMQNNPAIMEYRTGTANNFILAASGPVAAKLATKIDVLELNSVAVLSGVANTADAYTASVPEMAGIVVSDRVFLFTPNATNTTKTPTLSVNGRTARQIKQANGTNVAAGDLVAGYPYLLKFNLASTDFRLLTYPADRTRLLGGPQRAVVTSASTSPNAISLTIPGIIAEGTLLTFEPAATNTGSVSLIITDMYGNTATRTLVKGSNSPLSGGELKYAMPATIMFRWVPQSNFKLICAGDPATDIQKVTKDITALQEDVAELSTPGGVQNDPYAALAAKLVGSTAGNDIFGDITWNNGVKTVVKKPIICTSVGSSVGTGSGSGNSAVYAPNALFVAALKAELDMYGGFDIIDDNQCIPGQAFQDFSAQLNRSPYATSDFVLIVGGMNDGPVGNFNTGVTLPGQRTRLESLIDECLARGAIPIVCTTPHIDVTSASTYPSVPSGQILFPFRVFRVPTRYTFNADDRTIEADAFANPLYGGNILKPGSIISVAGGVNVGSYTIESISEDRSIITVVEAIPETSTYTATILHSNLDAIAEEILVPPPSLSRVTQDWTGGGILTTGDVRFGIVNNMMRSVARRKGAFLADCEYSWFKYGIEVGGYSSVYDPGNYNHPNGNGYTVSYGYALKVAAREIARLIFGEKYYAKA